MSRDPLEPSTERTDDPLMSCRALLPTLEALGHASQAGDIEQVHSVLCQLRNLLKACTQRQRPVRLHDRDLLNVVDAILDQGQSEDGSCECIDRVAPLALLAISFRHGLLCEPPAHPDPLDPQVGGGAPPQWSPAAVGSLI